MYQQGNGQHDNPVAKHPRRHHPAVLWQQDHKSCQHNHPRKIKQPISGTCHDMTLPNLIHKPGLYRCENQHCHRKFTDKKDRLKPLRLILQPRKLQQ